MQDIQLDDKKKAQLDGNIKKMLEGGANEDDIMQYASDFKNQFGQKKNPVGSQSSATQLLSQGANVLGGGILGDISKSVPKTEQKEKPRSKYDQPKVNPNRFLDIGEPVVDPNFGKNKAGLMVGQVPNSKPAFAPELAIRKGELQGRLANVLSTGKRPTNDELGQIAMIQSELQSIPQSDADAAFQKEGWNVFKTNPLLGAEFLGETVLSSLTSLFEAGKRTVPAAIGIGAAAGAPIAGIGAIGGAISGLTAGVTTGGFNLSTSGKIIQTLSDEGVDVADKDSLIAAFSDEVKMSKIRKRALKYGIPIAVLDAISGGFAGKLVAGAAGKSLAKRTLAGFGEVGMQSFAGMTGEAGGQYLADGKLNRDEILLEGIAGLVTDVPEIVSGVAMEKLKDRSSSKKTLATQVAVLGNEMGADDAKYNLNRDLANKVITPEEHEQGVAFVEKAVEINNKIPEIVIGENRATSIELIEERERLTEEVNQKEEQKKGIDVAYHKSIDESNKEVQKRIDEINNQLGELAKPEKNKVEEEIQQPIEEGSLTKSIKDLISNKDKSVSDISNDEAEILNNLVGKGNMSPEDAFRAFDGYQRNDYKIINEILRRGEKVTAETLKKVKSYVPESLLEDFGKIKSVLDNTIFSPIKKTTFYRNIFDEKADFLNDYKVGDTFTDKGISSVTIDEKFANEANKSFGEGRKSKIPIIKYEIDKGESVNGFYIGGVEKEFLINSRTKFIVTNKENVDGNLVITLKPKKETTKIKLQGEVVEAVRVEQEPEAKPQKVFAEKDLDRAKAKKVHQRVREMEAPSDAAQIALRYIADGGKVSEAAINEVAGTVKRARLNTGAKDLKSNEAKSRDYYQKDGETLDELAHRLWENSSQEVSEIDIKDALMSVIGDYNTRLEAGTAYLEQYNAEYIQEKYYERLAEEREEEWKKEQDELERQLRTDVDEQIEGEASEEHINNLIKQYESEFKAENQQPKPASKADANKEIGGRASGKEDGNEKGKVGEQPIGEAKPKQEDVKKEEKKRFFKNKPNARDVVIVDIEKIKSEKPKAFDFLKKYKGHENFGIKEVRNALAIAYSQLMKYKAGAETLIEQISELEDILEGESQIRKTSKEEFKKQAKESGDFTSEQLKIFNALVDSLDTEFMPEYDSFEGSLSFVGIDSKKTPNFYSLPDNILAAKNPDSFIHEIGHFSFFNILSKQDRIKYLKYMVASTYGAEGKPLRDRIAMTSEQVEVKIGGETFTFDTNVANNFSEYFAEQFRQWYLKEKTTPKEFDTIFEKVEKYLNKLIDKLRSGDYIDKNLIEFFDKIIKDSKKETKAEPKTTLEEKYEQINKLRGEKVQKLAKEKLISDNFDSIVSQLMTKNKIKRKC